MAQKRNIRVRISHLRVEALIEICKEMLGEFKPQNDHHFLLREYMQELQHRLTLMSRKPQDEYTLTLSGTEAVAFYQMWQMMGLKHDKYATVIVETMVKKITALAA